MAIPRPNKDTRIPGNYRPISLLCTFGKILEKVLHKRLIDICTTNNLLVKEQFGFRSGHSTTHQIKRITDHINKEKANHKSTGLILLDIEKTFDTVWHDGLLHKLDNFGIPISLVSLIGSFLEDRSFVVSYTGALFRAHNIHAGLPQGGVLSPLLYSLYFSDFKMTGEGHIAYYADDTAFFVTPSSKN